MMRSTGWLVLPLAVLALAGCGGGDGSGSSGGSSTGSAGSSTGSSSGTSGHIFSLSDPNVVAMTVGPGPGATTAFNIPTASVTICLPGTKTCTTVDKVLVDTGSYGLRLLGSALGTLAPPAQSDPLVPGNTIAECQQFLDGYTWGPVAVVDVTVGGEAASRVPINVIDDSHKLAPAAPSDCVSSSSGGSSSGGTDLGTVDALGANGVLGVGYLQYDCDQYCTLPVLQQNQGHLYYSCSSSTCSPTSQALADQVVNPVTTFSADNNGVILQMPAIPAAGQVTAAGYLVFGIGTRGNNALDGATVLTINTTGYITTTYDGQSLPKSFLDSGSNGYFFPSSSIPVCTVSKDFYCPKSSPQALDPTNTGANGAMTANLPLEIVNVDGRDTRFYAIDVGGPDGTGLSGSFDFGLPFFYGRTVFTAIEQRPADGTTGPYYAY